MGMGKRAGKAVMSGVLSLAMMLGMIPGMSLSVFAGSREDELKIEGTVVSDGAETETWTYKSDAETRTLTLKNYTYSNSNAESADYVIDYLCYDLPLTIVLEGENSITTNADYAIHSESGAVTETGDVYGIIIDGTGTLDVTGGSIGIFAEDDANSQPNFLMKSGTVIAKGANQGVFAYNAFRIEGGNLTAQGIGTNGIGLKSDRVDICGGTVIATGTLDGINAGYWLEMSKGASADIAPVVDAKGGGSGIITGIAEIKDGTLVAKGTGDLGYGITTSDDDDVEGSSYALSISGGNVTLSGAAGAFYTSSQKINNTISGMGWNTVDPTGIGTPIVSGYGENDDMEYYKKIQFPSPYEYIEEVNIEEVVPPEVRTTVQAGDKLVLKYSTDAKFTGEASLSVNEGEIIKPNYDYGYEATLTAVESDGVQYLFDPDLTLKVNGVVCDSDAFAVSSDGKTLTFTGKVKTDKGTQNITVDDSIDLIIGGSRFIGASTDGEGCTLSYVSSNTNVAIVGDDEKVTAKGVGTATITITASGDDYYDATATVTVNVVDKKTQTITANDMTLDIGKSKSIGAEASGGGALSYKSSNESVATVDDSGLVTANAAGTATITITAASTDEYKAATKEITVTVGKLDQTITAKDVELAFGDSASIDAKTSGDGKLTYASSNKSIATVDSTGKVTAVGGGTATITITAAETSSYKKATKTITVTVTKLDQTITAKDMELAFGGSASIGAKTSGNGKLTYAVKSGSAVTVDSTGKVVAKAAGTSMIEITAAETSGYNKATLTISVKVGEATPTPTKKPATPTPTKKPAAPTPTKKPATPTPTKKPATPTPTKKPATPTPTKKPATPTPTKKPATPTPTKKPATPTPTKKPDGRISVAKAKVEFEFREYTYYGTEIKPRIAVIVNGKQLKGKTDFTGELKNNNKVGTATITITGIGKYKDEVTKEFKIVAPTVVCGKKLDLSEAGVTGSSWKTSNKTIATVDNGVVTGKQAGPATISFKDGGKTKKFTVQVLYKDVQSTNDFWYEPTNVLTNMGVVKGYDKQTNFKPGNECSRAQMVTFLWRLAGEPAPKATKTNFKDIKKSDYFYMPVLWAVEQGITTGISKTKFGPQGICTRAQTVTFLWRMAGKPAPTSKTSKFKDVKKGAYYYEATIWASENKIVAGYSDGTFKPSGKCLRRQMVTFLYKYDNNVNGKD